MRTQVDPYPTDPGRTTPRRLWMLLAALAATALWQGCNTHAVEPFEENIVAEQTDKVGSVGTNKVDILWIVDNSGSMCEEQEQLRANFDLFIAQLVNIDVDFRLAVVTTDMMDAAESGRFQNIPDGEQGPACSVEVDISQCPTEQGEDPPPLVITSDDPRYQGEDGELDVARLQRDFGCNATVGTRGNGFEMGLAAARAALSPGLLETHNSGFLRDDAFLAVIWLTDENDCSDPADMPIDKTNGNICEWEADKLIPEQDYITFFEGLKPSADQLILAGIIAPDAGIRPDYGDDVLPSCVSDLGEGYAGYRYQNVIEGFAQSQISNICAENAFEAALDAIGSLIVEALDNKCLDAPPITCESNADCGGAACAARDGSSRKFCDAFRVQVEITRPMSAGPLDGRECEELKSDPPSLRCILTEGDDADYTLSYGDTGCPTSGISVNLDYQLGAGDELGVRYPRAVEVDRGGSSDEGGTNNGG